MINDEGYKSSLAKSFIKLYDIVCTLRAPGGCPWDREQTPQTLRTNLLEETYECIDAIDNSDDENLREELGDIFLLVTMIGEIKEEEKAFTVRDVLNEISEKLIRRHPHVFGNSNKKTVKEVLDQWEDIKKNVEGKNKSKGVLERVPKALPPLERALEIQRKVSKVGFDWKNAKKVWEKVEEELEEVKNAVTSDVKEEIELEIGDLMFTIVNLSRLLGINPTLALNKTNEKFIHRFNSMETILKQRGVDIEQATLEEMDKIWNEIKRDQNTR